MKLSTLHQGVLVLCSILLISSCRSSENESSSGQTGTSRLRGSLNFTPAGISQSSPDPRCVGTMARVNPEWDDSDLKHLCSWGADVSCLACWAQKHPEVGPSNILDNCLPDENGDDSDLFANGCYNGPGADYGGPYNPPQSPNPPSYPQDPNYGRNCGGRLAALKPDWSPGQLNSACSGADAECVVSTARQRPNWSPGQLNLACTTGSQPQPPQPIPQPIPPHYPQDPNYGRNCGGRLAALKPDWSPGQLNSACSGADAECVVSTARQRPNWSPGQLNEACTAR